MSTAKRRLLHGFLGAIEACHAGDAVYGEPHEGRASPGTEPSIRRLTCIFAVQRFSLILAVFRSHVRPMCAARRTG